MTIVRSEKYLKVESVNGGPYAIYGIQRPVDRHGPGFAIGVVGETDLYPGDVVAAFFQFLTIDGLAMLGGIGEEIRTLAMRFMLPVGPAMFGYDAVSQCNTKKEPRKMCEKE